MSPRRLLRVVLSVVALIFLWTRTGREWLAADIAFTVILVAALVVEVSGVQQKWKRMREEVPKKPLGLDT